MRYGTRHCSPGALVLVYLPKRVTTATCPSWTIMNPLSPQMMMATSASTPSSFGEPEGSEAAPPPPFPRGLRGPPPPRFPPKIEPKRLLKSFHTSSRSGGPSFWGRREVSSSLRPPSLRPPRPQPGSFRLNILDIERIVSRDLS